jgi:hypothetical protein
VSPFPAAAPAQAAAARPGPASVDDRTLTGVVVAATGAALPGAVLTLVNATGQQVGQATASDGGSYRIAAPEPGMYLLICRSPAVDGEPLASWVSIDDQATRHDVHLPHGKHPTAPIHESH